MLKYSQKLISTIALLAVVWPSQGYSQAQPRPAFWAVEPFDLWAYWLLFLVPASLALNPIKFSKDIINGLWIMVGVLFILIIGLRYNVGGDFDNYLTYLEIAVAEVNTAARGFTGESEINFAAVYGNASGYQLVNAFAMSLGFWGLHGIYLVNTFCGAIFVIGLIKFCKKQPLPWVALTVAVPYMVCAVSMGYTRQATALGFLMWGLSLLRPGNELKYIALVFIGSTFHLSVLATIPFVFCAREKTARSSYLVLAVMAGFIAYFLTTLEVGGSGSLYNNLEIIWTYTATRHSPGGPIRTYMNVLPVLVSLLVWKRIRMMSTDRGDYSLIKWLSIVTLLSLPALLYSYTMTDRMGIYLMPVQLALWPRIIAVLETKLERSFMTSNVIAFYGLVLYVFFHYANHAHFWVPYLMFPFTSEPIYEHPVTMPRL
jgi:hypothetical protein